MNKTRFSHKVIAVFLTLNFLQTFVPYNMLLASNSGPIAPEAAGFEPVDATDMVSLLSGDLSYVLPLLNVPSPEGGYPLALSYHGGVAVDQEASWVGLGWNVNPGAINRSVNGYPDDWNAGKFTERFYDAGGTETTHSFRANYTSLASGQSFGLSVSHNSNKGFGGSVSYSNSALGVGGSLGTDGFSIRSGAFKFSSNDGFGIDLGTLSYDKRGLGVTVGGNIGLGEGGKHGSVGLGFSFFTKAEPTANLSYAGTSQGKNYSIDLNLSSSGVGISGGIGASEAGVNIGFQQAVSANDYNYKRTGWGFFIPIPAIVNGDVQGLYTIGFSKQKIRWALNSSKNSFVSGVLNLNQARNQVGKYKCEVYTISPPETEVHTTTFFVNSEAECDCSLVGTLPIGDTCDGTNVEFVQQGDSFMDINEVGITNASAELKYNNAVFPAYDGYRVDAQGLSGNMRPKIYENGALMGLSRDYKSIFDYTLNYKLPLSGSTQSSYTDFENDIYFTFDNEYSSSLNINPVTFQNNTNSNDIFDYLNLSSADTQASRKKDGRFVQVFTNEEINNDIAQQKGLLLPVNNEPKPFDTEDGIGGYKITSPDGKTYHYSLPVYNHETLTRTIGVVDKPERESYFEKRQLKPYATHWLLTAVTGPDYIKSDATRDYPDESDLGYWVRFDYGKWSDAYVWKTPYGEDYTVSDEDEDIKTKVHGRKQIYYLDKVKTRTHTALFVKNIRQDNKSEDWTYQAVGLAKFPSASEFDTPQFSIPSQNSLRLEKVVLVKNEDDNTSKASGSNLANTGSVNITYNGEKTETASYNMEDKVLDVNDNIQNALNKAIKVIDFGAHYSYDLATNSPNASSGRLTLNGVSFKGKSGVQLLPSYTFEYDDSYDFNIDKKNEWGYHIDKPEVWSLNKVITPTGGQIIINYENDEVKSSIPTQEVSFNNETTGEYSARFNGTIIENGQVYGRYLVETNGQINLLNSTVKNISHDQQTCQGDNNNGTETIVEYDGPGTVLSGNNGIFTIKTTNPINYQIDPFTDCSGSGYHDDLIIKMEIGSSVQTGGGIRVNSISTVDEENRTYTIGYNYNDPNTGQTSGVVSYIPFAKGADETVPYGSELPPPIPMYEYVSVENVLGTYNSSSNILTKTVHKFKVLDLKDVQDIKFGDLFEITSQTNFDVHNSAQNKDVEAKSINVKDNFSCIGQILEISSYNSFGQLISKTVNDYASTDEITKGISQESFQTYKEVDYASGNLKDEWLLNASTKIIYPSVLKSTTITQGGYTTTTYFDKHDDITGQLLETRVYGSDGRAFKTEIVPAYTKYSDMGSKVDNISNKNMLTQATASYNYLFDPNDVPDPWKEIGVGITTWKSWNNDVWRKHRTYTWKGSLNADGTFQNYSDNFNWATSATSQTSDWQKISEISKYDNYSMILETIDINGNALATKMGDNDTKIFAVGNAGYDEIFYSGAEDPIGNNFSGEVYKAGAAIVDDTKMHSGKSSVRISANVKAFAAIPKTTGNYRVSVWVEKTNYSTTRVKTGSQTISYNEGEKVIAGNWVQLNFDVPVTANQEVYITTISGTAYYDDFRMHPVRSSMTTYVYNEWNELTHILGTNNLGTKYEYDDEGRLIRTYVEVVDIGSIVGGFKKISENTYRYQRGSEIGGN
ncbi:hypothetical protein GWK08_06000 [Leptobacterium flavescens]|uniref:Uncharacterized protein n=1 Tax=Leptobacterium flavescens TaxID=472055 RepID=A0A6P0UQ15_9FLAO|nr:hypothetical protein [Leptobacterium flavescens]NER12983.1 hypothetical protein [Leptobacterium flavescens]